MQKFAIIASLQDPAGINIRNNLIELYDFKKTDEKFDGNDVYEHDEIPDKKIKLFLTNNELVYSENIDEKIEADVFIFASKHRSKEDKQSFAVHAIGNWNEANLGGKAKQLCPSSAVFMKNMFLALNENANINDYEITLEATHHGPYLENPSVFVEIGSTEKEWNNKENGKIIAMAIMNGIRNENRDYKSCIVIGGGHYNQSANKLMLRTNYAVGHICPKYALEFLDEEMLMKAINKTVPEPNIVLLDWKGLSLHKQKVIILLEKINIKYERIQNILKEKTKLK